MSNKYPDKPVTNAAGLLGIDSTDLPFQGRPLLTSDVKRLQKAPPSWLVDARRRRTLRLESQSAASVEIVRKWMHTHGYSSAHPVDGAADSIWAISLSGVENHARSAGLSSSSLEKVMWELWPLAMAATERSGD